MKLNDGLRPDGDAIEVKVSVPMGGVPSFEICLEVWNHSPELAAECAKRLIESGLQQMQILNAFEFLNRGECLMTWENRHLPGRKYFGCVPPKKGATP